MIDDPSTSQKEVEYVLKCVRVTNKRLGGIDTMLDCLKAWSVKWPRDRAVTMLDIGTGAADLPLAAVQWARSAGFSLKVTGLDTNERVLGVARSVCGHEPAITLLHADATLLLDEDTSPFANGSFDYVHAGMFLHHLSDAEVPRMLGAMDRLARAGIIWNDLIRSRRGYAVAWLATLGRPIRHDCLASLRAGFTEPEVHAIATRAGVHYTRYHERFRDQRFSLAGERSRVGETPRRKPAMSGAASA
jgi:hypothetical protein